jgi:hypothetical protein
MVGSLSNFKFDSAPKVAQVFLVGVGHLVSFHAVKGLWRRQHYTDHG